MLEHADGNDAIVTSALFTVVEQFEGYLSLQSGRFGALLRDAPLFLRQGKADDVDAVGGRQVQCQTAKPGTDIEHPHAALEPQLCGNALLFVELCLLQAVARSCEVCTRILQVAVEKELKQAAVEIVVESHIGPRLANDVVLVSARQHDGIGVVQTRHQVAGEKIEHVVETPLLDQQRALHVGFAQIEVRDDEHPSHDLAAGDPDTGLGSRRGTFEDLAATIGRGDLQSPLLDWLPYQGLHGISPCTEKSRSGQKKRFLLGAWTPAATKAPLQRVLAQRLWRRPPAADPIHGSLAGRSRPPRAYRHGHQGARAGSRSTPTGEKVGFLRAWSWRALGIGAPPAEVRVVSPSLRRAQQVWVGMYRNKKGRPICRRELERRAAGWAQAWRKAFIE